jgi:hypothetical protein
MKSSLAKTHGTRDNPVGDAVAQKQTQRMSLIIAIEPDRDQAAQLKDLVRRHTQAELVLADTTDRAISAIRQRVPDLILIPAFLSPEDDEALTAALRVTEAAAHVQTLTIPVLGAPRAKSAAQGVLSRLRWDQPRPSSPDSCDPKLFAEQIMEYLQRVARERGPLAPPNGKSGHGFHKSGNQDSSDKPKAAAVSKPADAPKPIETPKPADAPKPAAAKPVHESRPVDAPKPVVPVERSPDAPPEALAVDLSSLEAVVAETDLAENAADRAPAPDEFAGLEEGLSSLLDRLSDDEPAADQAAAPAPAVDAAEWADIKGRESEDYAIPKALVVPRDEATEPPAATVEKEKVEPEKQDKEKQVTSEWGDLMDSLKKDLGR